MRSPTRSQRGDMADLKDELGDLLLQVVFHARIAEEAGAVRAATTSSTAISDKMERRHPHIFGDAADGGHHLWEQIKAEERAAKGDRRARWPASRSACPRCCAPRSCRSAPRASASTGPTRAAPRAKIDEEMAEVEAASTDAEREEEIGDLLFAVVNWARQLGIDPEAALRARQRQVRTALSRDGGTRRATRSRALDLDAKEALWRRQGRRSLTQRASARSAAMPSTLHRSRCRNRS